MTDLTSIEQATVFADELPNHEAQLNQYEAAGLSRPEAFRLETHAAKIISIGRRAFIEIGRELLEARGAAQYGTWGPFLERCGLEERSAQNYMRVAERFGDKPEIISALPATALYALAAPSADPVVVDAIVEEVRIGAPPPTVQEVKQRLASSSSGAGGGQASAPARPAPPVARPEPTPPGAIEDADSETDEAAEIAAAAPAPSNLPPPLPPLMGAVSAGMNVEARKLLAAKRALLAATLEIVDAELTRTPGPTIAVHQEHAIEAARLFVNSPALGGPAIGLAFKATVEERAA